MARKNRAQLDTATGVWEMVTPECARPRAQQPEKHDPVVIFLRAQKTRGLLRPGTTALRWLQCQD